jgi:DNA glycosylase AlkZ-like
MSGAALSERALGRATLARQLLLRRHDMAPLVAVEHLVGLQGQEPRDPYVALWSRLAAFDPGALERLLVDRDVVRVVVMRGTIHLVTAADCLAIRPLVQPVLDRELRTHQQHGEPLATLTPAVRREVLRFAAAVLAERPTTGAQLRSVLAERFPDRDAAALAYACRNHLTLVQVPPRGLWTRSGQVVTTTAESWLGRSLAAPMSIDALVLRYLAAFGPALPADAGAWSRLTAMGRVLFDLPDAPRPDPDTPAPVRFLPEYDNALLSHADRSRFVTNAERATLSAAPAPVRGTVLADGRVLGGWRLDRARTSPSVTMAIQTIAVVDRPILDEVEAEATRLAAFMAPDVDAHVDVTALS